MKSPSRLPARMLGFAALLLIPALSARAQGARMAHAKTTTNRPQAFGTDAYSVTVIPAGSFTSDTDPTTDYGSLYRRFEPYESAGHFYAGVDVPAGAVIDFIGFQLRNDTYYPYVNYQLNLFSVDQHSGTTSGIVSFVEDYQTVLFKSTYNQTALGFAWTQNAHQALVVDVYQIPFSCPFPYDNCRTEFGFGWVEVWWKRSVSPAPATQTFNDVAPGDFGYQFIEALAASGITGGCGGGNFCPSANLTRAQMAVFLAKALGLHWPY